MPPTTPALRVRRLVKRFHGRLVLQEVNLELGRGQLGVLIGRSGSGKSTLLRCLNGLEQPDEGEIEIAGLRLSYPWDRGREHPALSELRRKVGMVFQDFRLFPHMTLERNITAAPVLVHGRSEAEALDHAERLLAKVGLLPWRGHYPFQLSGGQQQRAAIARALAVRPELLLYDEPTSALDPHLRGEVLDVMRRLKREGMTQLVVTHEHAFARRCADVVLFLEEGRIIESGPPARVFIRPRHPRTRRFVAGLQ